MPVAVKNDIELIATIDDFRTLARKTKGELLPTTIGYNSQNCRFSEETGSIEKRSSRAKYNNMSTLGTSRVIFIDRFYKSSDATKKLIAAYSTFLKLGDDSDGSFTNIKTGLTASLRWKSFTFKNIWYGGNGTDNVRSYDGSDVNDAGVPIPDAPTFNAWSGTGLTGDYYYKVTYFIDDYQEGTASAASALIQPSNQGITLNIPVSTNTRATKRYLYRTTAGGSIYYFCKEIANNTALTVTDNVADGSLDTAITAPNDYGAPPAFKYMCLHKSRVFGLRYSGYLSRVVYSDIRSGISYPDVFPSSNYFDVIKDNGEEGTAIIEDNFGQLIVFKPSAVVKINTEADDPTAWSGFTNIVSINGCAAPYSIAKTHIGVIYLARLGKRNKRFMRWTGSSVEPVFEELEPILSAVAESRVSDIVGHYHNGEYLLSYSDPDDGHSYNDRVIIIDLKSGCWTIDKKNIDCFSSWTSGTVGTSGADEGELYSGTSDTTGFIYREDTAVEDLTIRYKSEIDVGTIDNYLTSGGIETAPTLTLKSNVSTQVGAQIGGTVTDIGGTLTAEDEYGFPSGTYISPVLEVNVKNLRYVYYNVALGSYGKRLIYIKTGGTEAACEAASWSAGFATGADISSLTAARYLQYKIKMFIHGDNVANYADVYAYRGTAPTDYVVRISFGLGTLSEDTIEMFYTSHWLDFGWLNPILKRVRKNFLQARIDFERSTATGNLTFGYYLDGSATITEKSFAFSTYASKGYCIYQFPFGTLARRLRFRLFHDDDREALKIKAVHFALTYEPIGEIV